ncbi:PLDc N-terminal domain-containing protein [Maribellus sediminis]|uniref:PLDc N-terminal domain-containing protein n=1 Tax=Maribellus sediminis TaxID=2696285 RepID=UPI0014305C49|nr:PLD nuclease N-terminal domain-containing protein [Maribellus sediminis]
MILLGFIGPQELILILIISLFLFILPIIALVNIIRSEFTGNNKIVWVLIVIFFNIIGSILYFLMGKNQKVKN